MGITTTMEHYGLLLVHQAVLLVLVVETLLLMALLGIYLRQAVVAVKVMAGQVDTPEHPVVDQGKAMEALTILAPNWQVELTEPDMAQAA